MIEIMKALDLNKHSYDAISKNYKRGITELGIKKIIEESYFNDTGEEIFFEHDIIGGSNSFQVSGPPTDYILQKGDSLIVDLLPRINNYFADTTRTFFVEEVSFSKRKAYKALCKTLNEIEQFAKAGMSCETIYKKMLELLRDYGYENRMPHHGGHGIGLTSFETPVINQGSTDVLEEHRIIAVELGIYIEGYGIRIENVYRVTKVGLENMFHYPLDIEHFILKESR